MLYRIRKTIVSPTGDWRKGNIAALVLQASKIMPIIFTSKL
jgi:hypothetical protein